MLDNPLLKEITLKNGDTIYLLGTAHVSAQSVEDVRNAAHEYQVDAICVEIDADRLKNMREVKRWRESDLSTLLKNKQGFLLLANLALASFQKKIGDKQGVAPGSEMKEAVLIAEEMGISPALVDRKVSVTLRRVWRMSSFMQKMKLLASLLVGVKEDNIEDEDIENLKKNDLLSQMMEELAKEFPSVKSVLIDERDRYLAYHIYHTAGERRLAVVGAGHMQGIIQNIDAMEAGESLDVKSIDEVPPPTLFSKMLPYLIPIAILAFIIITALQQESKAEIFQVFKVWILANSLPSLIGGVIALAHPLSLIVAILLAPFTSFIPMLSAGLVAALVQAFIKKPRASDFEDMTQDFTKFRFYKNRVLHVLLVFMLINIGSLIGTLIGVSLIAGKS